MSVVHSATPGEPPHGDFLCHYRLRVYESCVYELFDHSCSGLFQGQTTSCNGATIRRVCIACYNLGPATLTAPGSTTSTAERCTAWVHILMKQDRQKDRSLSETVNFPNRIIDRLPRTTPLVRKAALEDYSRSGLLLTDSYRLGLC